VGSISILLMRTPRLYFRRLCASRLVTSIFRSISSAFSIISRLSSLMWGGGISTPISESRPWIRKAPGSPSGCCWSPGTPSRSTPSTAAIAAPAPWCARPLLPDPRNRVISWKVFSDPAPWSRSPSAQRQTASFFLCYGPGSSGSDFARSNASPISGRLPRTITSSKSI
jgi:hypothetical protein